MAMHTYRFRGMCVCVHTHAHPCEQECLWGHTWQCWSNGYVWLPYLKTNPLIFSIPGPSASARCILGFAYWYPFYLYFHSDVCVCIESLNSTLKSIVKIRPLPPSLSPSSIPAFQKQTQALQAISPSFNSIFCGTTFFSPKVLASVYSLPLLILQRCFF